LKRKRK